VPSTPQLRTIRGTTMFCAEADRGKLAAMARSRQMSTTRYRARDFMFWGLGGLGGWGLNRSKSVDDPSVQEKSEECRGKFFLLRNARVRAVRSAHLDRSRDDRSGLQFRCLAA
jgi:hypothetical protein